jgi:myo-inositol-1(or 4)-monophosphatase
LKITRIDLIEQIAQEAGAFLLQAGDMRAHTDKSNRKDFFTEADIAVQDSIRKELHKHFPDVTVLSEEDSEEERKALYAADFTGFVIDPIDGTYYFKRDMQESAISIGYIENGKPVAGVAFDPYKNELFRAEKGKGATRNGERIRVSDQASIEGSFVVFCNSYNDAQMARTLKRHTAIYEQSGHMPWTSCGGSAVLVMCWIACGRIDALHHNALKPWDTAAAFIIAAEAGAKITSLEGKPIGFTSPSVIIGTPKVVDELSVAFNKLPSELLS